MNNDGKKQYNAASWYTGILNGITGAFGKFVGTFRKHGFVYTALTLILFVTCYTLIINPIRIDKMVEKRMESMYANEKRMEAETIQRRYAADEIMGDIMTKLIDKFPEVHRVLLLEAHNSLRSLQNIDFLYYSCTLEMITPDGRQMKYLSEDLQRQMRLNLIGSSMLNTLKHRSFMMYTNIDECMHPDHRLIHKLADAGDTEALIIPFLNEDKEPVILLVISGEALPTQMIVDYVNEFRKSIEGCLM